MEIVIRALCTALLFLTTTSIAGIQPSGTRIIYPAAKREVTFTIANNATTPRLIQAWIDQGETDTQGKTAESPFIVTPPIFRIDPDKGQTLRIIFLGGDIPQDRESIFWLNILELQPTPAGKKQGENNVVQFTIRTRLKLFYRPEGLPGKPKDAISQIRWRIVPSGKEYRLECNNPSVFNISFHDIQLPGNAHNDENPLHGMCPSKGIAQFTLLSSPPPASGKIKLSIINDFGGFDEHEASYTH
ncbi:chaperone protein EcpD [Phytobacter palmae]|nr:chaperone protein EcpD [Phytobacter palmae]